MKYLKQLSQSRSFIHENIQIQELTTRSEDIGKSTLYCHKYQGQ